MFFQNFRGCVSLFSYQGSAAVLSISNSFILPECAAFVKNFFQFFLPGKRKSVRKPPVPLTACLYYHLIFKMSTSFLFYCRRLRNSFYRNGCWSQKMPNGLICFRNCNKLIKGCQGQNMRKKWEKGPTNSECFAGLWEHGVRNHPFGIF